MTSIADEIREIAEDYEDKFGYAYTNQRNMKLLRAIANRIEAVAGSLRSNAGYLASKNYEFAKYLTATAAELMGDKPPAVSDKCGGSVSEPRPCRHCGINKDLVENNHDLKLVGNATPAVMARYLDCPGYEPEEGGGDE